MRVVICFLYIMVSLCSIKGLSQNANITFKTNVSISLEEVFNIIKSNTDYEFIYKNDLIENSPKITIYKGNIKVSDLLKKGLDKISCTYEFLDSKTIIVKKQQKHFVKPKIIQQKNITITGYIFDSTTNKPLPYVNIGFLEKAVGTVSDEHGKFRLTFNPVKVTMDGTLQISSLGYETLKIKASKFYGKIAKNNKIYLNPEPLTLDEVIISNDVRRKKRVGSSKKKENSIGYWLNKEALGGEIAAKININHKKSKLHNLKFYVIKNNSGVIKVRVNVYEYNNGLPGMNVLKTNIYHTISKPFGEEVINLDPYNIVVNDDIIVSIELIKVHGTFIDFAFAASRFNGTSFTRHLSQDKWKKYDNLMAFSLNTSYPIKKDAGKTIVRDIPKKITLYWDTSITMKNRNLKKELGLLRSYLNKLKNVEVEVIKFSRIRQRPRLFIIKRGNVNALVTYLESSIYDGATDYSQILKENEYGAETSLVFTDGNANYEHLKQLIYVPTFYINSLESANHSLLQKEAWYGDGHYINLLNTDIKEGLNLILKDIVDEKMYSVTNSKIVNNVFGKITSDSLLIQGAKISVNNTLKEVVSDKEGNFNINAKEGDILKVEALGMFNKEVIVQDGGEININLKPDGELLDEVLLTGKVESKRVVQTAYGEKNFDAIGYQVDEITNKDINASHHTFDQIVTKLPGVIIMGFGANKRYFFARNMSKKNEAPIIVIDNVIYSQTDKNGGGLDKLPPIDFQTIKSVRALKSIIATNRYGGDGAYGAIVFETEASSPIMNEAPKPTPSMLVTGNDYNEDILLIDYRQDKPNYISQLEQANSYIDALNIYKTQKYKHNQLSIPFFIDASKYFERWDKDYAYTILSNIAEIAKNNAKALKVLAYKLDEQGRFKEATFIYERLKLLRPKEAQSYRDLALNYEEVGFYKKAMNLYKQMLGNNIEGADFNGLKEVVTSELKHLIALHASKVDSKGLPSGFLKSDFKYDTRIVFDWNDANTEFEVQFVNPKKKFFKWSQTKLDNPERMLDGITKGYHTEEFIIDEDQAGEWIINIESLNEESSLNPTYLKYTVYKNYGLANETKKIKVVNLNDCNPKVAFDKLVN